jgi:hypothetical protein
LLGLKKVSNLSLPDSGLVALVLDDVIVEVCGRKSTHPAGGQVGSDVLTLAGFDRSAVTAGRAAAYLKTAAGTEMQLLAVQRWQRLELGAHLVLNGSSEQVCRDWLPGSPAPPFPSLLPPPAALHH